MQGQWSFYYSSKIADSRVQGLVGENNAGTPNTKYDFKADLVQLRDRTTGAGVIVENTATLTCDVGLAGPAANGRDQSGAFSASSWIHFYFIWNPATSTLALLASAVAPPTGPTLPTGYTHWAYATTIRFNGSSQLQATFVSGAGVYFIDSLTALSGGSAITTPTAIDLSTFIPPNAALFFFWPQLNITADTTSPAYTYVTFGISSAMSVGFGSLIYPVYTNAGLTVAMGVSLSPFPNKSQTVYYFWGVASTGRALYMYVWGYSVPNGGS